MVSPLGIEPRTYGLKVRFSVYLQGIDNYELAFHIYFLQYLTYFHLFAHTCSQLLSLGLARDHIVIIFYMAGCWSDNPVVHLRGENHG